MIFYLVLLATASASPVPQGLTLAQFRQGARSLYGGGQKQEIKVEISPSYRKIRRHGRTQFIDPKDTIKKAASSRQEVYPSARPVFVNAISDEDIEQKIREVNKKELMRKLKKETNAEKEIIEDLEKDVEEAMEEVIEVAIEEAIKEEMAEELEEELELGFSDDSDNSKSYVTPEKLAEEINFIDDMINDNKMIKIVTDIIELDDGENDFVSEENFVAFETAPVIIEEKKGITNIDGFNIGSIEQQERTPLMEIPLTSQILIIDNPIDEESESVKIPARRTPISSIDFGLIQEV